MGGPKVVPVPREVNCSELHERLGSGFAPKHPGALHPHREQLLAETFDEARTDHPPRRPMLRVLHEARVVFQVSCQGVQGILLLALVHAPSRENSNFLLPIQSKGVTANHMGHWAGMHPTRIAAGAKSQRI